VPVTRAPGAFALVLATLVLVGCASGDPERAVVERVESWTTENTTLSVVRNHDPFNLGGPTFPDEVEGFVGLSPVASFWPIELPEGLVLRGATLTLVEGEPEKLQAAFFDPHVGQSAEVGWQVVDFEVGPLSPDDVDTLSFQDGVLIYRWSRSGFALRIVGATGCGHSLTASFPVDTYSDDEIQRAVGRQFIDCR
jgi:hypothetical protein